VETARAYDADARRLRAERILDAAAKLLLRWGCRRLTMDDVAAHAGIGKGTIYLHWKTREALFEAVLQRELMVLLEELAAAVRQDPLNALPHRLGRLYFLSIMQRPLLRAFFTMDMDVLGELAHTTQMRTAQVEHLRHEFLRLLVEHGLIRDDISPADLAYAYRTIIVGFFLVDPIFSDEQPTLERKAERLEMAIQGSLGIDRQPSPEALKAIADHVLYLFSEVLVAESAVLTRQS
jgi:AcrR family transcriptional regulator